MLQSINTRHDTKTIQTRPRIISCKRNRRHETKAHFLGSKREEV